MFHSYDTRQERVYHFCENSRITFFAERWSALAEAALGPSHLKVITCRQNYTQLLREMQRQAKAEALKGHRQRARTWRAHRSKKE